MFGFVISVLVAVFWIARLPFHTHTLQVLADPVEHEIMALTFSGGPCWSLYLLACQLDLSSFIYCGVRPHGALACWLFTSSRASHQLMTWAMGEERQRNGMVMDCERSGSWCWVFYRNEKRCFV